RLQFFYAFSLCEDFPSQAGKIRGVAPSAKHGITCGRRPRLSTTRNDHCGPYVRSKPVIPDDFTFWGDFEDSTFVTATDECVPIFQALSAGNVLGEKIRWLWCRVTPNGFIRPEGGSRFATVLSLGVNRRNDLIHGRKIAGPTKPIIECQHVTRARKAGGD